MGQQGEGHKPVSERSGLPAVLLILGTDLAGKDHVANVLQDGLEGLGVRVERRRGSFSGKASRQRSSEGKGLVSLALEWLFLVSLPLHCRLLPYVMAWVIRRDLRRFCRTEQGMLLVVSHTAIRLAAFSFGLRYARSEEIRVPPFLENKLRSIATRTGAQTLVLDIEPSIRAERIAKRMERGTLDCFDRYMAADALRSERIERTLVWLATNYLGAKVIENNNLEDRDIFAACFPGVT